MSKLRKILLPLIILALIVLIILTWGTMGSVPFIIALIMVGPTYLLKRFVYTDRESDFIEDDNG